MKIICIGHAAYDITIPVIDYPIENTKNRVNERVECGGGPASNAAYLLGKWGMDVSFMGIVGNDTEGETIKKELESVNVDTTYLELNDNYKTTSSFIIANKSNGSRTILTYRPNTMNLTNTDIDFTPDIILIDGQEVDASINIINKYSNAISIIDASRVNDDIIKLCHMVNYVVCSLNFAEGITNLKADFNDINSLSNIFKKLEEKFNNNIVVTLEDKGCLYKYDRKIKIMPSIKVKAIDSTGAGDIFHGAFTYGIAKNLDFEQILKISNIAGALSVKKIGGRYSVPSLEEIGEYCDIK